MNDAENAVLSLVDQWISILIAKFCYLSDLSPNELKDRVALLSNEISKSKGTKIPLQMGHLLFSKTPPENIDLMLQSIQSTLSTFSSSPLFPKIFSLMMDMIYSTLSLDFSSKMGKQKAKSLHTESIVTNEELNDSQKLSCSLFTYISQILEDSSQNNHTRFDQIDPAVVKIVFHFLNHDHPNEVRSNAGKILTALSRSPVLSQNICDLFWSHFNQCKKDDDFRNFASWIDGVVNLQLSLNTQEMSSLSFQFLQHFINSSKKIERGVLRMKFLDALSAILTKLSKSPNSHIVQDFKKLLTEIWNIVVKWSTKSKHTTFSYAFLVKVLSFSHPTFFLEEHGPKFGEMVSKASKNGEIEMLEILTQFIHICPKEYSVNRVDEFTKLIENHVLPVLFSGNDKKRQLRFKEPKQVELISKILIEIGLQHMVIIVDFSRSVLQAEKPNDDHKKVRLCVLIALSELTKLKPDSLSTFNTHLFSLLESILLLSSPGLPEEILYATLTFPLLHSQNDTKVAQIAQFLFDTVLGSKGQIVEFSFLSLKKFISDFVNLTSHTMLPLQFIDRLCNNLPSQPKEVIILRLNWLNGVLSSLHEAFSSLVTKNNSNALSGSKLKNSDWAQMRISLDQALLPLILNNDNDILNPTLELIKVLQESTFLNLDLHCISRETYFIPSWIEDVPKINEILLNVNLLISKDSVHAIELFDCGFDFWKKNYKSNFNLNSHKMLNFLSSIAFSQTENLKNFFIELFILAQTQLNEIISTLSYLNPSLWSYLLSELDKWLTTSGKSLLNYWTQFISIYNCLLQNNQFSKTIKNQNQLIQFYENLISIFLKSKYHDPNNNESFNKAEKLIKIFINYLELYPEGLDLILTHNSFDITQLIKSLLNYHDLNQVSLHPTSYNDSFLKLLILIISIKQIDTKECFNIISIWIYNFSKLFESQEQIQILITRLLTIILQQNLSFIRYYFNNSLTNFNLLNSNYIISIANTYFIEENRKSKDIEFLSIILCTILIHINSEILICRQSSFKLMSMILSFSPEIFNKEIPINLIMSLTSENPFGFNTQSQHFIEFISQNIKSEYAFGLLTIFSEDITKVLLPHSILMLQLTQFVPILLSNIQSQAIIDKFLLLTSHSNLNQPETADSIHVLWQSIIEMIHKLNTMEPTPLLLQIFNFSLNKSNLKNNYSIASILVLTIIFKYYPTNTLEFLFSFFDKYNISLPTNVSMLSSFLMDEKFNFNVTKEEIIAYNCLSEVLLLIQDRKHFLELFTPKLPTLVFYAVIMYHVDDFVIGSYHSLLDSILDTSLFRLVDSNELFSSNLEILQSANLIKRAVSIDPEYQITLTLPAKQMLCYDKIAIRSLSKLLCQTNSNFEEQFYNLVLANAFRMDNSERSVEPFIMMISFADIIPTSIVYQLLLFTVYAFVTGRSELMDSLIDIISQRLLSKEIEELTFELEAFPVLIVFILSLSIENNRSFSIHLTRIIADITSKICNSKCAKSISTKVIEFMKVYNGDQYIASLFKRFVEDSLTFSDSSITDIIRALYELSKLFGYSSTEYNWCLLFSLLIDGTRYFLGEITQRIQKPIIKFEGFEYTTIKSFITFLSNNFKENYYQIFILSYLSSLNKTFKTLDLNIDIISMEMICEYLYLQENLSLTPQFIENLIRLLFLVSLTSSIKGKKFSVKSISYLINNSNHNIDHSTLSLNIIQPKFIIQKRKPIGYYTIIEKQFVDPNLLPNFLIFNFSGMEMNAILDTLWQFISSNLSSNNEKIKMPDFKLKNNKFKLEIIKIEEEEEEEEESLSLKSDN